MAPLKLSLPKISTPFHPSGQSATNHDGSAHANSGAVDGGEKGQHRTLDRDGSAFAKVLQRVQSDVAWIPANLTFSRLKPVMRSSIVAWLSLVFLLIPRVEKVLGDAGFLIVIAAFISPPNESLTAVVEKEIITSIAVTSSWAWSCLGIKLASLARTTVNTNATNLEIFSGEYIEAAPCVILAIFLFVGTAVILALRAWLGSGPFAPATLFSCLCVDISLTVAPFFPYPNYLIGRSVVIPVVIHSGLSILASFLVFPESVAKRFMKRFRMVLEPLAGGIKRERALLQTPLFSDDFDPSLFVADIAESEVALVPLTASARLVERDVSWGRFPGEDLRNLQTIGRKLVMRAAGIAYFYRTLDACQRKFTETLSHSYPATPTETLGTSRSATPNISDDEDDSHEKRAGTSGDSGAFHASSSSPQKRRRHSRHSHQHHSLFFHIYHHRILREALNQSQERHEVGVFESQRYMNIEKRRRHPHGDALEERSVRLLAESVEDILTVVGATMDHVLRWLEAAGSRRQQVSWDECVEANERVLAQLCQTMDRFSTEKRHIILEPYKGVSDPLKHSQELPPHRYLFRSFVYQYHLMRFSECLYDMMNEIDRLDKEHRMNRFRYPMLPMRRIFSWSAWEVNDATEYMDDENPDVIPGMFVRSRYIGDAQPRDADALPPSNTVELIGTRVYAFFNRLVQGNGQFAIKAGILSVLLSLPNYIKDSASFAYAHKSIWALFIAQLTLARYRGDTISAFVARIISTFFGGLVALVFWYMACGSGAGNPYGLAAVGVIVLPILSFARAYVPGPPTTVVIFATTVALIVGYSWQNSHIQTPSHEGYGWVIAWRRFLLVVIGVVAATTLSFLPPSTTTAEIGFLYCAIVSHAHNHRDENSGEILRNLVALRSKLKRMRVQTTNVQYEFSLRGKWPAERYNAILSLQLEIAYLLSHLMSVVDHLEPKWSNAFLQRTRFLDPDFLADVLAVITMISTSLRTATPLPQITPAPLIDRFWVYDHGLNVFQQENANEHGLPKTVTFETLQDEQYQCFSVGVSSAAGIISRLDRLMQATKELVGERFHIDGVLLPPV